MIIIGKRGEPQLVALLEEACANPRGGRTLNPAEIAQLETRGCQSERWDQVRVSADFNPERVWNVRFRGLVQIGSLIGEVDLAGFREPCGLRNCVLENVRLGDGVLVRDTLHVANMILGAQVAVAGCGFVTYQPGYGYGVGRQIALVETGQRVIHTYPEMSLEEVSRQARPDEESSGISVEDEAWLVEYASRTQSKMGAIAPGSCVLMTSMVENCYIGQGTLINGAQSLRNCVVLGSFDEPTEVSDGAQVRSSMIQWGCHITSGAIVEDSLILEHSTVELHGKVRSSILGPSGSVAEGEVTSSLVGPLVGFHHQALLIAACWPEGRGNVAYGCNCGSNHTGKLADQELWPGEGLFLGLGVNVKYPGNFSAAPYSVIASGATLLPQKVTMPFALIMPPATRPEAIPEGYNEILPGWVLRENLFAVLRNEKKYTERYTAPRNPFDARILRPEIMARIIQARAALRDLPVNRDWYTDRDLPGLGKNFLTSQARELALDVYTRELVCYGLKGLWESCLNSGQVPDRLPCVEPDTETGFQFRILADEIPDESPRLMLQRYHSLLGERYDALVASKVRDDKRGSRIIPDYDLVHEQTDQNRFVIELGQETEATQAAILRFLAMGA